MARTTDIATCANCGGRGRIQRHLLDAHHAEGGGECSLCQGTGLQPSCIECEQILAEGDPARLGLCRLCAAPRVAGLAVCGEVAVACLDEIA